MPVLGIAQSAPFPACFCRQALPLKCHRVARLSSAGASQHLPGHPSQRLPIVYRGQQLPSPIFHTGSSKRGWSTSRPKWPINKWKPLTVQPRENWTHEGYLRFPKLGISVSLYSFWNRIWCTQQLVLTWAHRNARLSQTRTTAELLNSLSQLLAQLLWFPSLIASHRRRSRPRPLWQLNIYESADSADCAQRQQWGSRCGYGCGSDVSCWTQGAMEMSEVRKYCGFDWNNPEQFDAGCDFWDLWESLVFLALWTSAPPAVTGATSPSALLATVPGAAQLHAKPHSFWALCSFVSNLPHNHIDLHLDLDMILKNI